MWFLPSVPVDIVQHVRGSDELARDHSANLLPVGIKVEVLRDLLPFPGVVEGEGDEEWLRLRDEQVQLYTIIVMFLVVTFCW